jgi:hypothetical protein
MKRFVPNALFLAPLMLAASTLHAQQIGPQFALNGDSRYDPGVALRLTANQGGQTGSAWLLTKQEVAAGFRSTFQFRISQPGGYVDPTTGQIGGDGFAFVIQNTSLTALGAGGGSLGYTGIPNSLAIEFDTWQNADQGDPNGNHISVHWGGFGANSAQESYSLGATTAIPYLEDGRTHVATIDYRPGVLRVFVDNAASPALSVPVELSRRLSLDGGRAWMGFTGATGAAFEAQEILSWLVGPL